MKTFIYKTVWLIVAHFQFLQPLRHDRHHGVGVRGVLGELPREGRKLRPVRAQGSQAPQGLQGHKVRPVQAFTIKVKGSSLATMAWQ